MYVEDQHYYIIRRESKFVYWLTIWTALYFNWFGFAMLYSYFACNLLFDDEDEDYVVTRDFESEFLEYLYGIQADDSIYPKFVSHTTLTKFLELVIDLPTFNNISELDIFIPDEHLDEEDNFRKNYFNQDMLFSSLNTININFNPKENYFLQGPLDVKTTGAFENFFNMNNFDSIFLESDKVKEHDILIAHLFKGSRELSTYKAVEAREAPSLEKSVLGWGFIKKIYLKKLHALQYKADLAYNDYIFKSYIIQVYILILILNLIYLKKNWLDNTKVMS